MRRSIPLLRHPALGLLVVLTAGCGEAIDLHLPPCALYDAADEVHCLDQFEQPLVAVTLTAGWAGPMDPEGTPLWGPTLAEIVADHPVDWLTVLTQDEVGRAPSGQTLIDYRAQHQLGDLLYYDLDEQWRETLEIGAFPATVFLREGVEVDRVRGTESLDATVARLEDLGFGAD